ncbi:MAG TPA: hypothetical protein PLD88_13305, partial [Candidatus Berkiella sp.]|nr:hypothetical protein [Candidatus Berkiella sp.]
MDEKQSGKFKLYGGRAISKELIIAEVKCQLGEISPIELEEIKQSQRLAAQFEKMEILKLAQMKQTGLSLSVYKVLNDSVEGKKYIELFSKKAAVLKVVNEKFSGVIAKIFIEKCATSFDKISELNDPSLTSFLRRFAELHNPALTDINQRMAQKPVVVS